MKIMRPHQPDYLLFGTVALLFLLGLITLFSASSVKAEALFGDPTYYLRHQLLYGILPGALLFLVGYRVNHRFLQRFSFVILIFTLALLFLLFLPQFGVSLKGATRWVKLGPIVIQPSEFFKLGFIIYLASYFANRQGKVTRFFEVGVPFLIILGFVGFIFLSQPAAGTLGVIALTALGIYFLAGGRTRDIVALGMAGAITLLFVVLSAPYRLQRVQAFLDPGRDPQGVNYQLNQALISIGSGGFFGVGIGHSRQKYNFLPETMSDSIFAIFAEEGGLVGSLFLLGILFFFSFRGLSIAKESQDNFARFLAGGITIWIVIQSLMNIGANSGLIPLTGIPLPFFSYGGSAMTAVLAASGILLNLSRYTR